MKRTLTVIPIVAALAWACGGNVKHRGDGESDTEEDQEDVVGDAPVDGEDTLDDTDHDVVGDTTTDTPVDSGCTDGEIRCSTDGAALEECVDGAWTSTECEYGCVATGGAHCAAWVISNIPDPALLTAGEPYCGDALPSDPAVQYDMRMDTDTGAIDVYEWTGDAWSHLLEVRPPDRGFNPDSCISFEVVAQGTDLPELGVFSYQQFSVPANYMVSIWGPRPLVILSEEEVLIEGNVHAGCNWETDVAFGGASRSGEGAGAGGDGTSVGAPSGNRDGGGGGGAFGGGGGTGGGYDVTLRGVGGTAYGTVELIPLLAGSGGGQGGGTAEGRWGGRSGGAIQIVSGDTITVTGWVDASGCGGQVAYSYSANEGGGGGGSGGGVLLEAPAVVITGQVTANGGGGAAGGSYRYSENGEDGHIAEDTPALGGTTTSDYSCDGGNGNDGASADGVSAETCDTVDTDYNGGGGGAGGGRIRVNGMARVLTGALFSPGMSTAVTTEGDLVVE